MRIGIDCRMYGLEHAGIGRYVENLVINLLATDNKNEYVLFVRKSAKEKINTEILRDEGIKCRTVVAEARHYSLKEQFLMPYFIAKEKVDLMHFPHFNVPFFYFGKYVVTIHDLIKHESRGTATTTRNPLWYWLKYLGYQIIFYLAVTKAERIFIPSKTVAQQLKKKFKLPDNKLQVTYEGVDDKLKVQSFDKLRIDPERSPAPSGAGRSRMGQSEKFKISIQSSKLLEKYNIKKPYLLYVGSVYPHKNLPNLISAVKILNQSLATNHPARLASQREAGRQPLITLTIVCARSVFWERLEKELKNLEAENFVNLIGFVPDEELGELYRQAVAFVFPSESEGFGLPGLEAMAAGLPVLASNIPVFKEVYQNGALYFEPKNPENMAEKIKDLLGDKELQEELKKRSAKLVKIYSWEKMAKETLDGYQKV